MQQHIRSQVDQAADALQFGTPIAIYHQVLSPAMKRLTYGPFILYIFLAIFLPSILFTGSLLSTPKQSEVFMLGIIYFLPISILTLIGSLIFFRHAAIPWYVLLYSEGFISAKGSKIDTACWNQVTAIRQESIRKNGFPGATSFLQDTLSLVDETQLSISDMFLNLETAHFLDPHDRDMSWFKLIGRQETEVDAISVRFEAARKQTTELLYIMEREIVIRLFSKMVATYQEGLPVTFGQLQMSIEGISNGKTTLPWNEFDHITLYDQDDDEPLPTRVPYTDSRTLVEHLIWWQNAVVWQDIIYITGKNELSIFWSSVVSNVPNAFLLMELADYALNQQVH